MFEREIVQAEWETLMRCAPRVHSLKYIRTRPSLPRIAPTVLNTVYEHLQGRTLFPNLKHLTWSPSWDDNDQHLLRVLLSSTVVSIRFHRCFQSGFKLREDLEIISSSCDSLQETNFFTASLDELAPLRAFRNLRIVRLEYVRTVDVVEYLCTLPKLEELSLTCPRTEPESAERRQGLSSPHIYGEPSPTLKRFILRRCLYAPKTTPIGNKAILAQVSRLPMLSAADLNWSIPMENLDEGGDITPHILSALKTLCVIPFTTSLRTLHVSIYAIDHRVSPSCIVVPFGSAFAPLLLIHTLAELDVVVEERGLSITPDDLACIAAAWPSIKFLSVRDAHPPSGTRTLPSITSLVAFARRCRVLEVLRLGVRNVGSQELQALEEVAHDGGSAHGEQRLAHLHIADRDLSDELTIEDVPRLAAVLRRIFPGLRGALEGGRRPVVDSGDEDGQWMCPLMGSDACNLLFELDRLDLTNQRIHSV